MSDAIDDNTNGPKRTGRDTKFKRGVSGNPKGRPKGSRNMLTELNDIITQTVAIREDGKHKKISRHAAIILKLIEKALQGDVRSASYISNLWAKLNPPSTAKEASEAVTDDDRRVLGNFLRRNAMRLISEQPNKEDK